MVLRHLITLSVKVSEGSDNTNAEIVLYETVALGEGRQSNNPWLQELPDSVSKICWDNFAAVSPFQAKENNWNDGDILKLGNVELPVHIQPGQAYGTIGDCSWLWSFKLW